MAIADQEEKADYAAAQLAVTEAFLKQSKVWRHRLISAPSASEPVEETDRLQLAQLATRFLEMTLRPAAVRDPNEIRRLVVSFRQGQFLTGLNLDDLIAMITDTGAILRGHFVLLSEMHSDYFFMFSRLGSRVAFRKQIAAEIAARFRSIKITSVVAPLTAGGLLVQDVARELKAKFAFYDFDDHSRPCAIRRGYSVEGPTLILNDMTTTGEGLERMIRILSDSNAKPAGIGLVATRGTLGTQIIEELCRKGHKVEALFNLAIEAFPKADCAKCRLGLPFLSSADINR